MFNKKIISLIVVSVLLFSLSLTAGAWWIFGDKENEEKAGNVKITLLNSKGEIQSQLEEAAKSFSKQNPKINMEVIPCSAGESPYQKVISMYSSGNAPNIAMLDAGDVVKFKDKVLDLSSEKWVDDTIANSLDMATTNNGKVVGFPVTVEGYGLIYNKKVLNKAVKGEFNPDSIRTTKDLENLFQKIEASGTAPIFVSPMDWSLGGHFLSIGYGVQSSNSEGVRKFIKQAKAGEIEFKKNKGFNGLLDTFSLMKKYNVDKNDPLSGTYDRGAKLLAQGEVGLWFMGNWAWPLISKIDSNEKGHYGFLPVPISNNPGDYGNSQISVGVTKYFVVDKSQSSEKEIAAAKKFLNWLVYDKSGQELLVNKAKIIPAFENIKLKPNDPLAKSILSYVEKEKTLQFVLTLPPDHGSNLGAVMQKYLAGRINKEQVLKEIEKFWKNVD